MQEIYYKKPLIAVATLAKRAMDRIRGTYLQVKYGSGKSTKVGPGCRFDALYLDFGKNLYIGSNVHIFGIGKIHIGNNVTIADGTVICCHEEIYIGDDAMIAAQCYIIDCNHGIDDGIVMRKQPVQSKPTRVGNNVWIGCGCKILAGAEIGDGSVVHAGNVVTSHIKPDTIYVSRKIQVKK